MENSTTVDPLHRHIVQLGIEMFFSSLIMMASIVGNLLVIYVCIKDPRLKSTTNVLIQNLAMTDVSMAVFNMPQWLVSLYKGKWIFSQLVCDYEALTMFAFGSASILTMAVIAVNRFVKVVKPQSYKRMFGSRVLVLLYCGLTWLIGLFFATPPLYGWGIYRYHMQFTTCSLNWELDHISFVAFFIGGFVNGVTVTIFVCYYKIYKTVKTSAHNIASHAADGTSMSAHAHDTEIKVLKSTFAVVCCYLVCWIPVSIACITETAGGWLPREVYAVTIFLMYTSSCINPMIYGIMNPQFKRAFIAVFKRTGFANVFAGSNLSNENRAVVPSSQTHDQGIVNSTAEAQHTDMRV